MKPRSAKARETAPGRLRLGRRRGPRGRPAGERGRDEADDGEGGADADGIGDGAEHRAEDRPEDGGAERGADQLAAALARCRDGQPGEGAGPGRRAREALHEPGEAERPGPFGGREGEAGDGEQREAGDDGDLRPPARGGEPAGDAAEERAGAEGGDEQPGTGLGEAELVRVPRDQRRERTEQHRVHEHDTETRISKRRTPPPTLPIPIVLEPGSEATLQGSWREKGPLPRIPFFLRPNKFSEPVALSSAPPTDVSASAYSSSGGASTYSRSVLAARGNLGAGGAGVKGLEERRLRKLRVFPCERPTLRSAPFGPQKIQRAGCAFVLRSDELSASAYGLPDRARPTRVPCSLQGGSYGLDRAASRAVGAR